MGFEPGCHHIGDWLGLRCPSCLLVRFAARSQMRSIPEHAEPTSAQSVYETPRDKWSCRAYVYRFESRAHSRCGARQPKTDFPDFFLQFKAAPRARCSKSTCRRRAWFRSAEHGSGSQVALEPWQPVLEESPRTSNAVLGRSELPIVLVALARFDPASHDAPQAFKTAGVSLRQDRVWCSVLAD